MSDEYDALIEKVDEFCSEASQHGADALACAPGCDGCCHVWLTVSPVEAEALTSHLATLDDATRARIRQRGLLERAREAGSEGPARCAMLEDDGRCAVYAARPLICRTQGLALRYPKDTVPEASVRWRDANDGAELVACPLNYTARLPQAAETLNADQLNILLAIVNQRYASDTRGDPNLRSPLSALAAGDTVLASP